MKLRRRAFLRILAGAVAFLAGRPAPARAKTRVLEIHRATRNTLAGALDGLLSKLRRPPARFKAYAGAERTKLPALRADPALPLAEAVRHYAPARGFREAPLSLAELGRLLYFTNGVTGRRGLHLRAAPSAGALYSGEVYVVAERVSGLPSGVYYYDVMGHAVVRVQAGSFISQVADALERPGEIANVPVVILLTNVFHRYTWRYANRGYRYALIDSGHIGENLRLSATSAGFGDAAPLRFHDDRLNAILQVDGRAEAVCAVHLLGAPADRATGSAVKRSLVERHSKGETPLREEVIERYHEATKLVDGDAATPAPTDPVLPPTASPSSLALPETSALPTTVVEESIQKRRSARHFEPDPIALEDLSFVLEMAQGPGALERAPGVELYLAAHRVKDLAPGLYRYEAKAHRLAPLREGDLARALVSACLGQEKAGAAAVAFLMVAKLTREAARAGDRSYRDLLIESGAIGQRIYLSAESAGLAARNLAAFMDDELNELMGLDGQNEAVVHLTVVGHGD